MSNSIIERFIPVGSSSLSSDAPGWNASNEEVLKESCLQGPSCWKCKGMGKIRRKQPKRRKEQGCKQDTYSSCPVCYGKGTIAPKQKTSSTKRDKLITRKRKHPNSWRTHGPIAHAVKQSEQFMHTYHQSKASKTGILTTHPLYLLHLGNKDAIDDENSCKAGVSVSNYIAAKSTPPPPWLPIHTGEQLCNLVGTWRILQKVGSHRWTTDDLVTAYIAKTQIMKKLIYDTNSTSEKEFLNYLDLGCGNGSVLQMVCWSLIDKVHLEAFGIEARSEAVDLARRSLTFNMGPPSSMVSGVGTNSKGKKCNRVTIIHGDFRELEKECTSTCYGICKEQSDLFLDRVKCKKFDLITGTPPYFRVDFSIEQSSNNGRCEAMAGNVTSAVISQGGMPTAVQSAPARCEFRGGIEAYCLAASKVLSDNGIFVVCENSMNRPRVRLGAKEAGLSILRVQPVKGKETRSQCLFDVYVMTKVATDVHTLLDRADPISVRNDHDKWTLDYANILEEMSIPAKDDST